DGHYGSAEQTIARQFVRELTEEPKKRIRGSISLTAFNKCTPPASESGDREATHSSGSNSLNNGIVPEIAVAVLNYNGLRHLEECFKSLEKVDYPADKLRIVFVDNG